MNFTENKKTEQTTTNAEELAARYKMALEAILELKTFNNISIAQSIATRAINIKK